MAASKVEIVKDADGGYSVVGKVDGLTLTFATVNPSEVHAAAAAQGVSLPEPEPDADADAES